MLSALPGCVAPLGLRPVTNDPVLERQERADRWHVVVGPASGGWVTLWPEAMVEPDGLLRGLTGALGCAGFIAAGQPGFLWAFEVALAGATEVRWRSDEPGESAAAALAALIGEDGAEEALARVLAAGGPEAETYGAACATLGCEDPSGEYETLAEPALVGEAPGHTLLSFSRSGLARPPSPRLPKAPQPPRT